MNVSVDVVESRTCTRCGQAKPLDSFKLCSKGKSGRSSHCRRCTAEYAAASTARRLEEEQRQGATSRTCNHCKAEKRLEEFYPRMWECKECLTDRRRNSRALDPLFYRRAMLRSYYQMTPEDYDRLLEAQNGACAVCQKPPGKHLLHVDHDHACCPTKKTCGKCVRGLLCYGCNGKIGLLESDSEYAKRLRAYAGVEVIKL